MSMVAAAAGLKWTGLAKLAGQGVTWTITLVVIRVLDPADYGITAVAAVILTLLGSVADFGLGAAVVQARTITAQEAGRLAGAALMFNGGCAAALIAASPLVSWAYTDPRIGMITAVLSVTLILNAFATVPESLLYREMRFKRLALIDVSCGAIGSISTLALALTGWGFWSLVLGSIAGATARAAALMLFSTWVRPRFALDGLARHLGFGGSLTASRLAWQGAQQCDVLIGGRFLGEAALGLYSVSIHLARLPMQKVMSVINQVAFPVVARMQDDPRGVAARLVQAIGLLGLLAVPLLWGLSAVAPEFVLVVLGDHWARAALPLQIAAFAMPAQLLSNVLSTALTGVGRADLELRNMVTTLVVTVCSVAAGAQLGHGAGLAAGWAVASLLACMLNFPRTNHVLELPMLESMRVLRAPIVAGLIMYAAVSAMRVMLRDMEATPRLAGMILAGAVVYAALVTMLDPEVWSRLRRLTATVRSA